MLHVWQETMPSCSHKCTTSASAAFNRLCVWHDMKPSCSHACTTSASAALHRLRVWHDMKPFCSHACTTSASAALHRLHVWHEAVIYAACWYVSDCTHVYLYVSRQCHSTHDPGTRLLRCVCFCGERYVILADGGMIVAQTLQYMRAAKTYVCSIIACGSVHASSSSWSLCAWYHKVRSLYPVHLHDSVWHVFTA